MTLRLANICKTLLSKHKQWVERCWKESFGYPFVTFGISKSFYLFCHFFFFWNRFSLLNAHTNSHIYRNAVNGSQRYFTTRSPLADQIVTPYPPLSQPLANLPAVEYAKPTIGPRETRITTLPNGLRVASESRFGQFCTIGGKENAIYIVGSHVSISFS